MSLLQRVRRKLWRQCYVWLKARAWRFNPCRSESTDWISGGFPSACAACQPLNSRVRRFNAFCSDSTQAICHLQSCLEQWKHLETSPVCLSFSEIPSATIFYEPKWTIPSVKKHGSSRWSRYQPIQTIKLCSRMNPWCLNTISSSLNGLPLLVFHPRAIINICYLIVHYRSALY